jgi:hypothetical protein
MRYGRRLPGRTRLHRVRNNDDDDYEVERPVVYDLTVYDDTPDAEDTGLVFPDGEPIVRFPRGPLGFLDFDDLPLDDE